MSFKPSSTSRLWFGTAALFVAAIVPLAATLSDPGITWDEPVYRESQRLQAEWFSRLARARSWSDLQSLVSREATHDLWMSARFGLNFHPPLAGMLANLAHLVFGHWLYDLNARRLASALELAAAAALLFHFLARRYGGWVGAVAGSSLLLMPRVFGHGHIAGTDMPMLFFWATAALAYWNGQTSRAWRAMFAVLLALAFLVKLSTVFVIVPLVLWHLLERCCGNAREGKPSQAGDSPKPGPASWRAGLLVLLVLSVPLLGAGWEARRLARNMRLETTQRLPAPEKERYLQYVHLLDSDVASPLPGWILLLPAALYGGLLLVRHRADRASLWHVWVGCRGAGFETVALVLAVCPVVVLILNVGWWRDPLLRIGHYSALFLERKAALPDIEIFYLGQKYVYSLPWHNGWVMMAVTVPLGILLLALVGGVRALGCLRRDSLPMFFFLNAAALPVSRMLPTPAHDGVRLMLPTFFFLAGLAGVGFGWLAELLTGRRVDNSREDRQHNAGNPRATLGVQVALLAAALGPAAYDLIRIHPYELSYYNRAVGGLAGAMQRGFEVSYWYDAVTPRAIDDVNRWLPQDARISLRVHTDVFGEWQQRGHPRLRKDIQLHGATSGPRFAFLLTHSSKSNPTTRLLFAQRPAFPPVEHAGVRLFSIYNSPSVARAQALDLLTAAKSERVVPGSHRLDPPALSETVLEIARRNPGAILEGARRLADGRAFTQSWPDDSEVKQFLSEVIPEDRSAAAEVRRFVSRIAEEHPNALREAARILGKQPEAVARIIRAEGYFPLESVGGYLNRTLAAVSGIDGTGSPTP